MSVNLAKLISILEEANITGPDYFAHDGIIFDLNTGGFIEDTNIPPLSEGERMESWHRLVAKYGP